jgi:hypothetical protein
MGSSFFQQGPSTTTGSSQSQGWPYAQWGLDQAKGVTQTGMNGGWVAPMNQDQTTAMNQIRTLAGQPNELAQTGYNNLQGFLGNNGMTAGTQESMGLLRGMADGSQAGQNPALMSMMEQNASLVGGQASRAARSVGASGSPEHQAFLAKQIGAANNPLISQAYESDRNRQLQASGLLGSLQGAADGRFLQGLNVAPTVDEMRYGNAQKLAGVGDVMRGFDQEGRTAGRDALSWYGSALAGAGGMAPTTTTSTAYAAKPSGAQQLATWGGLLGSFL